MKKHKQVKIQLSYQLDLEFRQLNDRFEFQLWNWLRTQLWAQRWVWPRGQLWSQIQLEMRVFADNWVED